MKSQNVDVPPPLADPNVIFLLENNKKIQSEKKNEIDFKCAGRAPGYYADVDLGCKVDNNFMFLNKFVIKFFF